MALKSLLNKAPNILLTVANADMLAFFSQAENEVGSAMDVAC